MTPEQRVLAELASVSKGLSNEKYADLLGCLIDDMGARLESVELDLEEEADE